MIVIDASMALAWTFKDEQTPAVVEILRTVVADGALVPLHWRIEVANVLTMAVRAKRIDLAFRSAALNDFAQLPLEVDVETNDRAWVETLDLADRHSLTVYDAAYLELAVRRGLPLATLDKALIAAARAVNGSVLP